MFLWYPLSMVNLKLILFEIKDVYVIITKVCANSGSVGKGGWPEVVKAVATEMVGRDWVCASIWVLST